MKTKFIYFIIFILALSSCWQPKVEEEKQTEENNTKNIESQVETEDDEEDDINLYEGFKNWTLWNIVCKTHIEQEWWIVNQIFYISWIRMSLELTTTYEWKSYTSYMISDKEYTYTRWNGWAFKTKIDEEIDIEEADEELKKSDDMYDTLENMPYSKCEKWDVDEDKFKIPDWIEFMDLTDWVNNLEWMQKIMGGQENTDQMALPEDIQKMADQYNIQ